MRFDAKALTRLYRVSELAVSPDGRWAAVSVRRLDADERRYVSDLYRVPLDGGSAVRLTRGPSKDVSPRFRRDGALAFLSNRNPRDSMPAEGDTDRMQVWILPFGGGEPMPITDEPLGVTEHAYAADADVMVVLAEVLPGVPHDQQRARAAELAEHGPSALHYKEQPVRHWDAWLPVSGLHAIAYEGRSRVDLTPHARHQARNTPNDPGLALSPDGTKVAIAWSELGAHRIPDGCLREITIAGAASRDLGRLPGVSHAQPRYSKTGVLAAERSTRRPRMGDVVRLCVFDGDDAGRAVAPDWDTAPNLCGWTEDGALLATAPDHGTQPAYRVELGGTVTRLTDGGGTHEVIAAIPGSRAIAGVRSTFLHPPETFVCEPGGVPRLVAPLSGFSEDDGRSIARWESRTTPGDGGTPVQWFLLTPREANGPAPLLLWIHGGPVSQFSDGWHWRWNPMIAVAAGYAVALPNPRGSTGRGQAFVDGVFGNTWGGACYQDLVAVTDEAAALPAIDGTRMAAMGGSYGGYMANWIGTQTDRFRCLVSHAGLFHLTAFYGSTDYPGYMFIEFGEHPFGDVAEFRRYSPDAFAMQWKTPVLFIHGEKDYRVPITEALIGFEAVRTAGAEAELLVFPDENHWILRPRNIRTWYDAWLEFVGRYLR